MNLAGRNAFNAEFFASDPIKPSTWRRMCATGQLPGARQIGGLWRADIDEFRAELQRQSITNSDPVMEEAFAIMRQIK